MAVPFQHPLRDVPRERRDRLFAHPGIFGEARDECVPKVMPPIIDACRSARGLPGRVPLRHRLRQVNVVQAGSALVARKADLMLGKDVAIRLCALEPAKP